MTEQHPHPRVTGVYRDDITRIARALATVDYPAPKWQLIAHATSHENPSPDTNQRTIDQLWALPNRDYTDLNDVITGLARTARGHPPRRTPNRRTHPHRQTQKR